MSYLFHLGFGEGHLFLTINGIGIIKSKKPIGLLEFAGLKRIAIDTPYKGGWIPFIEFSNIFGKSTKFIGVNQDMADTYELINNHCLPGAPEEIVKNEDYEVTYIKGFGKEQFTFLPKKTGLYRPVFIIKEIKYRGDVILPKLTHIPQFGRDGQPNSILDICDSMHKLSWDLRTEQMEANSKLT